MRRREFEVRVGARRLIAEEAGPEDGDLVLFHTGTPGSRRVFERQLEEGAERGLRHVTCSRPGYEGSDRCPGRSFADSVEDSVALVDALGVDRFYTVGVSGGGAPTLACAALVPERVRSAASISALGPREGEGLDWLRGAAADNHREFAQLEAGEAELRAFIDEIGAEWRKIRTVQQLNEGLGDYFCEADRNLSDEFQAYQVAGCQEIDPGDAWGWFDDDWALWMEWGFDLSGITRPVTIWQGGEDRFVPPQNGEWLAAHIPGAKLRLLHDDGHLSMVDRHYGEILDDLIESADEIGGDSR
jgi:pimeloyl-ACP methyl ester carboxylesterase